MPYIEWFDKLATGLEEVDNQHKKLVDIINELYDTLRKGLVGPNIDKIFHELVGYAIYHFDTEEELMNKHNYPGYAHHKEEHDRFKDIIKEFLEEKDYKRGYSLDLLIFLRDWLVKHIIVVDKKMGAYICKKT